MFVLPIVDLWTGKPVAYALTDNQGTLVESGTPRELYLNIYAAIQREYMPIMTRRPAYMAGEWESFIKRIPASIWIYENGEVQTLDGLIMKDEDEDVGKVWMQNIDTKPWLKTVMKTGVHYGSGFALAPAEKLEISTDTMYQVQWAL